MFFFSSPLPPWNISQNKYTRQSDFVCFCYHCLGSGQCVQTSCYPVSLPSHFLLLLTLNLFHSWGHMTACLFFWATFEPPTVTVQLSVQSCIFRMLNSTVLSSVFPVWQRQGMKVKNLQISDWLFMQVYFWPLGKKQLPEHARAWLILQDKSCHSSRAHIHSHWASQLYRIQ